MCTNYALISNNKSSETVCKQICCKCKLNVILSLALLYFLNCLNRKAVVDWLGSTLWHWQVKNADYLFITTPVSGWDILGSNKNHTFVYLLNLRQTWTSYNSRVAFLALRCQPTSLPVALQRLKSHLANELYQAHTPTTTYNHPNVFSLSFNLRSLFVVWACSLSLNPTLATVSVE